MSTVVVGEVAVGIVVVFDLDDKEYLGGERRKVWELARCLVGLL